MNVSSNGVFYRKRHQYPQQMFTPAGTQKLDAAGLVHTLDTYDINISISTKRSLLYEK
jgi:hypothetical protein